MVGFHTKKFIKHDDYMTPKYAWENIKDLIPRDLVIWEPFYGDGKSGEYLQELGFNVIHKPIDFFDNNLGDIIISNPPFSQTKQILKQLLILDKPFILLLPCSKIYTSYLREWKDKNIQIIIPRKRIQFTKILNNENIKENKCNFDCFYYCYKIGLEQDIVWLE
jgi:hypothetical protein